MFQLFLRARAQQFFRNRQTGDDFRARASQRDAETDRRRFEAIKNAIDGALQTAESEHSGLSRRIDEVLARAAVAVGTATDEYIDREPHRSHHLDLLEAEIASGQRRLKDLSTMIGHLKFLRAALLSRFPDMK